MIDHVNLWFHEHRNMRGVGKVVPHMILKSGFVISVQASEAHYCTPRDNEGPYLAVEMMFLSSTKIPATLKPYLASKDEWGVGALFFNVPTAFVNSWIEINGGLAE
jgi:hypothetical protein